MKIVSSGFSDVCVTIPTPSADVYNGIQERFYCNPATILQGRIPNYFYEGELVIEKKHTLCGMFYQAPCDQYAQMIRCSWGGAFVGVVDIRPDSKDYRKSKLFHITAKDGKGVCIPRGFAVGIMTEADDTVLIFKMEKAFCAEKNLLLTPFDETVQIKWPADEVVISAKERYAPGFAEVEYILCNDMLNQQLLVEAETGEILGELNDEDIFEDGVEILDEDGNEVVVLTEETEEAAEPVEV